MSDFGYDGLMDLIEGKPDWRELHPGKVCQEEIVTEEWCAGGWMPEYSYCWNAKVHGYDKCWVHLTTEQRKEFRAFGAPVEGEE